MIARSLARSAGVPGAVFVSVACGPRAPVVAPPPAEERVAIVASERGPHGARLVAIDEHGDRRFELITPATEGVVRDLNAAVSPDGRWLVFASTRGRRGEETSLWIAPLAPEAAPARLTDGPWLDSHPAWTRDGAAIVFASTRDGGDFDLWRLPIAGGRAAGPPVALTSAPSHEVTPSPAPGGAIVYAAVTPEGDGAISRLEERAPDGAIRVLSAGPADKAPAVSPDGAAIAFARTTETGGQVHAELYRLARAGGEPAVVVPLPLTDETGPAWSRDGRFLFATSVLRGAGGNPLFSAVIHVELGAAPAPARILIDRAGPNPRFMPAVAAAQLDAAALRADPEYQATLARIVTEAIERVRTEPPPAPSP